MATIGEVKAFYSALILEFKLFGIDKVTYYEFMMRIREIGIAFQKEYPNFTEVELVNLQSEIKLLVKAEQCFEELKAWVELKRSKR